MHYGSDLMHECDKSPRKLKMHIYVFWGLQILNIKISGCYSASEQKWRKSIYPFESVEHSCVRHNNENAPQSVSEVNNLIYNDNLT